MIPFASTNGIMDFLIRYTLTFPKMYNFHHLPKNLNEPSFLNRRNLTIFLLPQKQIEIEIENRVFREINQDLIFCQNSNSPTVQVTMRFQWLNRL